MSAHRYIHNLLVGYFISRILVVGYDDWPIHRRPSLRYCRYGHIRYTALQAARLGFYEEASINRRWQSVDSRRTRVAPVFLIVYSIPSIRCLAGWKQKFQDQKRDYQAAKKSWDDDKTRLAQQLAGRDGQITSLQNQIQNQQTTIDQALVQLGKAQQQEPFKLVDIALGPIAARHKAGIPAYDFILLTNRAMNRVRIAVTCDNDIVEFYSRLLGGAPNSIESGSGAGEN